MNKSDYTTITSKEKLAMWLALACSSLGSILSVLFISYANELSLPPYLNSSSSHLLVFFILFFVSELPLFFCLKVFRVIGIKRRLSKEAPQAYFDDLKRMSSLHMEEKEEFFKNLLRKWSDLGSHTHCYFNTNDLFYFKGIKEMPKALYRSFFKS